MFEALALRLENLKLKNKISELAKELDIDCVLYQNYEIKNICEELTQLKKENEELIDILIKMQNELNYYKIKD